MLESQIAHIVQAARTPRDPEVPDMDVREGVPASRRRTRALDPSDRRIVMR
ncbi:hypothetical protein [Actinomadura opuntiae]|uniref:hypothetical protein n=1 Tax=Actinomadura sp. OS1-43 TaxID=604315 RepID=UPI00255A7FC3|nr:hypothetical protein [Actinomadura sp. OS1-43]MDL4817590.1 hypothetical protein [Actinomadura sp. OS1-43]